MKKTLLAVMAMVSLCSYGQLAVEGFETWPVSGWTTHSNGGTGITWQQADGSAAQPAYSGSHAAYLDKENVPDGTVAQDWLVSPSTPVPINAVIKFASRLTIAANQGSVYKLLLLPPTGNPDNLSDYITLQQWTELELNPIQADYILKSVAVPAAYAGTIARFAFYMEGDDADRWLVDDVGIFTACNPPTNLTVTNITLTSAQLNWTGDAAAVEIEVVAETAVPTGIGTIYNGPSPYTITGLLPGTTYKVYMRSKCADGGVSEWVGPLSFSGTMCPAPTDVTLVETGLNSLTYSWTPTSATIYDYFVTSANGEVPNASTIPSGFVTESTVVITPLTPGVNYKFYVRAVCGPNTFSQWAGIAEPAPLWEYTARNGIVR
jgi:hypothetical protein